MLKILVIEDELSVRENLAKMLTFEDFKVITAQDGAEGVKLAEDNLPDLIICDIMMPVLDGYAVRNELCQSSRTSLIPFIFLTAKADRDDLRKGMAMGADDYITKPFSKDELLDAIYAQLDKKAAIQNEIQDNLNALRQSVANTLPNDLLESVNQIQEVLTYFIENNKTLDHNTIFEMSRAAYASSVMLQKKLSNYFLFLFLENASQDEVQSSSIRQNSLSTTDECIENTVTTIMKKSGRERFLTQKVEAANISIMPANLNKIVEGCLEFILSQSKLNSEVYVSGYKEENYFALNIIGKNPFLVKEIDFGWGQPFDSQDTMKPSMINNLEFRISKKLIEIHNGKLDISCDPHHLQVSVYLPLA